MYFANLCRTGNGKITISVVATLFDFLEFLQTEFFEPGLQIFEPEKYLIVGWKTLFTEGARGTCVSQHKNSRKNHMELKKVKQKKSLKEKICRDGNSLERVTNLYSSLKVTSRVCYAS